MNFDSRQGLEHSISFISSKVVHSYRERPPGSAHSNKAVIKCKTMVIT